MQTFALLLDSWRLLVSRKLFWLTLVLNVLVVVLYGSIAITESGVSLGFGLWEIESEQFRAGSGLAKTVLLPFINYQLISFWLAWVATGLGLITTASIFPDFLAEGAIDMVLAKPMSRAKAFFVKYLGALLFVVMQVTIFCLGSFIVARVRLGEWQWMLFASIPLVTLFFSYIYCVSVLVGVMTRSSIAAILAAAIFWMSLWAVQSAERVTHRIYAGFAIEVELREKMLARDKVDFDAMTAKGMTSDDNAYERLRGEIESLDKRIDDRRATRDTAASWFNGFHLASSALPKTQATISLLDRWFASNSDQPTSLTEMLMTTASRRRAQRDLDAADFVPETDDDVERLVGRRTDARVTREENERSLPWVLGTSVAFELAVLGVAVWIFRRRDF